MNNLYKFDDKESFRSDASTEFAKILLDSPPTVRTKLSRLFGISIQLDTDPIRISYKGRTVGIGSFNSERGEINFSISPKVKSPIVKNLFTALGDNQQLRKNVHYDKISASTTVDQEEDDDFTPVFLLRLLDDIVNCSSLLFNAWNKKKEVNVRGGVRGRPLLVKSLKQIITGQKTEFICQVLNDEGLREYAIILLETAKSINAVLDEWYELTFNWKKNYLNKIRLLSSRFGHWQSLGLNQSLLYRLCRPPFPFGLRDILYKCLKYWKWRGGFQLSATSQTKFGHWNLAIDLDQLFEKYVGAIWESSANSEFEYLRSPVYPYKIESKNNGSINKLIIPDHLLVNNNRLLLAIIDAKYSVEIGSSDQVYQMISYLSYDYPEYQDFKRKVGLLIYPGENWQIRKLKNFDKEIYCVQMPVTSQITRNEITTFLSEI